MLKQTLRDYLKQHDQEDNLRAWFEPLLFEENAQEKHIAIIVPHIFFQAWLKQHGQARLVQALQACTPGYAISIRPAQASAKNQPSMLPQSLPRQQPADLPGFADFISNAKNTFPLCMAQQIATGEHAAQYNPFVLCGKEGTGKTHLLQAMAQSLRQHYGSDAVLWLTATSCSAAVLPPPASLWQRYRAVLLDDLCALSVQAQEWLLLLVHKNLQGQLILACTGKLTGAKQLLPALRTRLEAGLVVELKEPDLDIRLRFIRQWVKAHSLNIHPDHMLLLARRCRALRPLQGLLLKIAAFCSVNNREATLQDMEDIVRSSSDQRDCTHDSIIGLVAAYYDVPQGDFTSTKRTPRLVLARQVAMYLCRDVLGLSYAAIGQIFNGKDHSTVIYAIKKIKQLIDSDKVMHKSLSYLRQKCTQ